MAQIFSCVALNSLVGEKHKDAFFDSVENAMKRRDWWSPNQFEGCKAEYLGISLDRVNMNKVIGML